MLGDLIGEGSADLDGGLAEGDLDRKSRSVASRTCSWVPERCLLLLSLPRPAWLSEGKVSAERELSEESRRPELETSIPIAAIAGLPKVMAESADSDEFAIVPER